MERLGDCDALDGDKVMFEKNEQRNIHCIEMCSFLAHVIYKPGDMNIKGINIDHVIQDGISII